MTKSAAPEGATPPHTSQNTTAFLRITASESAGLENARGLRPVNVFAGTCGRNQMPPRAWCGGGISSAIRSHLVHAVLFLFAGLAHLLGGQRARLPRGAARTRIQARCG